MIYLVGALFFLIGNMTGIAWNEWANSERAKKGFLQFSSGNYKLEKIEENRNEV